ncbi:hypothetical protein WOC76_05335 [Methylocystis sp. IM3]|uniref:hypothetical protein n=1 Tax=unclassified Methylocystis TaxID=2625913 RepID=UPI0030F7CD2E
MKGLEGMLEFLSFLRDKRIKYRIQQQVDDGLEVSFDLVGCRVEVTFFVDHFEFSYFVGKEDVETDEKLLYDLISTHWD